MISYYAILRADAVVSVNPMLRTNELRHFAEGSRAKVVALVGQDLQGNIAPLIGESSIYSPPTTQEATGGLGVDAEAEFVRLQGKISQRVVSVARGAGS